MTTKSKPKRTSGPALTRQRHRELGHEQLCAWLPADLVAAWKALAKRRGQSATVALGLLLMREVTEDAIRSET